MLDNAAVVALLAFAALLLAYFTYGRFLAKRIYRLDPDRRTPAHEQEDGVDFVPTPVPVLFGHHFASIAGLGPILGPAIAVIWGWVPAVLWVVVGCIFIGAVHDLGALAVSIRFQGRTIGECCQDLIGPRARLLALLIIFFLLALAMGAFVSAISGLFINFNPDAIIPSFGLMLVAMVVGLCVYKLKVPLGAATTLGLLAFAGLIFWGVEQPLSTHDYFVGGERIDLTILGETAFASRTQDLESLPIATPIGQVVPLGALAMVEPSSGPEQIVRRERQRAITISVSPDAMTPLEEAMDRITNEIVAPMEAAGDFAGGYLVNLSGTADKLRQTWDALRWNLILALAITYLLMAALFESWLYPFVIIFSVPLGAVGGILGLQVLNLFIYQPLDVLTMLGFVILIGTVVNNPILIVHQSLNYIRMDGMQPRDAIPAAVRTRVRPIFMTTLTTVLGLMPLVVFPGAGSELYRGLGSVVLGGLIVSTVFTLVLVPTVFVLALRTRQFVVSSLNPSATLQTTERREVSA